MEPKVISKGERWLVYGFFACIDALQVALDLTVAGEVANHFIDIGAGAILFFYGTLKKLWTGKKLFVLLATFIGEQIPFVNALPFWTLDIRNLYSGTITEQGKVAMDQEKFLQNPDSRPLNVDGARAPVNSTGVQSSGNSMNQGGYRAPSGGLHSIKNQMVDIKPSMLK